jgi:plastocyanin
MVDVRVMFSSTILRASSTGFHRGEHEKVNSNKPNLSSLSLVGVLIFISVAAFLIVPAFGVPEVQQTATGSAESIVYIIAPAGSGSSLANFSPADVTLVIGVNNTVVLKNEDMADHTITSNPGDSFSFDTGDISGLSSSAPIVFTTPGVYPYHCTFHPSFMHGTITVLASPSS